MYVIHRSYNSVAVADNNVDEWYKKVVEDIITLTGVDDVDTSSMDSDEWGKYIRDYEGSIEIATVCQLDKLRVEHKRGSIYIDQIHHVDSLDRVYHINVDANGRLDEWPPEFFNTHEELLNSLLY